MNILRFNVTAKRWWSVSIVFAVTIWLASVVNGADSTSPGESSIESYLAARKIATERTISDLSTWLRDYRSIMQKINNNENLDKKGKRDQLVVLQQQRKITEERLGRLKTGKEFAVPSLFDYDKMEVGLIGTFDPYRMERDVSQARESRSLTGRPAHRVNNSPRVVQVIDDKNMLIEVRWRDASWGPYWITGHHTEGLVDERPVELPGVFWISGTKQYDTADDSTQTVLMLEPIDIEAVLAAYEQNNKSK